MKQGNHSYNVKKVLLKIVVFYICLLGCNLSFRQVDTVEAEDKAYIEKGYKYCIVEEAGGSRHAEIRGYLGNEVNVVVPDTLGGCPVYSVHLFTHQMEDTARFNQIESVEFPKTMINLTGACCMWLENLTNVTIHEGTEYIGQYSFHGCHKLKSITIPASVTLIDSNISDNPGLEYCVQKGSYADKYLTGEGKNVTRTGTQVQVTGLSIDGQKECTKTLEVASPFSGRRFCINASLTPSNASNCRIKWAVSNPDVIRFNEDKELNNFGKRMYFDVKKGGSATITAVTDDGGYTVSCTVNVKMNIACHDIKLEKDKYEYDGTAKKPKVTVGNLIEGKDYSVEYCNNINEGTATVVVSGLGLNTGSVSKSFTIMPEKIIKVSEKKVKVSGIKISTSLSNKIAVGKKVKLTAKVSPSNASNKKVTWKSSNKKIATVSQSGVVTMKGNSGGKSVTITATAADGSKVKATYKITSMKGIVKKIAISGKTIVKNGRTLKLTAKVTASKKANKKIQWTSSNKKYATVNSSGKVKALKAGKGKKVKITAMATDGSGKKKTVTVKIK